MAGSSFYSGALLTDVGPSLREPYGGPIEGGLGVPLKGPGGSCWVDIRQV